MRQFLLKTFHLLSFPLILLITTGLFYSCEKEEDIDNEEDEQITCPSTVQDYEGNTYQVVKIGKQCWMAENLKTTHYADGSALLEITEDVSWNDLNSNDKGFYDYDNQYGPLYTWAAAMNGSSAGNSNPSGIQGICPDGWHLPSDNEWEELAKFISEDNGGYDKNRLDWYNVGGHLKATEGWYSDGNGTDDYGFSGFPGGIYSKSTANTSYRAGYWWTSARNDTSMVCRNLWNFGDVLYKANDIPEGEVYCFSVRCIKDN